ncbi:IS630 family transposase [Streptomyces albus]|uniref:IS630 family transposase n=1 Tax=Streptomyces albus TaxID=1888 RepID=UPI0004CA1F6F|nr:IS630 family transposase [Streptomyces albus]
MSRPGPKIPPLSVTDAQRAVLEGWVRRRSTAQALAQRSRIVLECAEGHSIMEVSRRLGASPDTVRTWRRRFIERGLDGLSDEPRPGVPRKITDADVERVIVKTLEEKPKNATHWSTRSMAAATGMSQSAISRIWRAFALAPHRSQTFKLSTDPLFIDKVRDVVGLYLDPPEKALVLCVDEKSQIQALDRSQPVLPMAPGVPERRSHDYVRAGTTTLFAALEVATGKVIGSLHRRHRAVEFKKFLAKLDKEVPPDLDVHLILDNYVTHKTPVIKKWLPAHPRFHLHFTPTSSSWLNLVERWFAELTQKKLKRGVHRSVQALEGDIRSWLADWNNNPRPFVWTKTADEILDKVAAYCRRISDSGH